MSFLRLVHNENMKLYKRKIIWIMLLVLISITIINIIITFNTSITHEDNWKENLENEIAEKKVQVEDLKEVNAVTTLIEEEIAIKQYQIEHNILPLYTDTAFGFVNSTLGYVNIITFFIILIASSIVSQEYSWGTINLVLMRPVKRWKILLSKYISIIFNALAAIIALIVISTLTGMVFFGLEDQSFRYVYTNGKNVNDVSIFIHFIQYTGSKFVGIIMISAFAFMLSTLLKNNTLAISLSIIIQYSGSVISNVLIVLWNNEITKYLFFSNTNLYQYVEGTPSLGMTLEFSIIILIIYFFIFMVTSILVFTRRDIVN